MIHMVALLLVPYSIVKILYIPGYINQKEFCSVHQLQLDSLCFERSNWFSILLEVEVLVAQVR